MVATTNEVDWNKKSEMLEDFMQLEIDLIHCLAS